MLSYYTVLGQVKLRLTCFLLWINNNKRAFPNQFKTLNDSVNMCEGVAAKLLVGIVCEVCENQARSKSNIEEHK